MKKLSKSILRITLLVLFFQTVLWSCAAGVWRFFPLHKDVEPDLDVHREALLIITEGKLGTKDIRVGFSPKLGSGTVGRCNFVWSSLSHEIDINMSHWNYFTSPEKIVVLAHEYIHCQCNFYGHLGERFSDGCPDNIMYPMLPERACINRHYGLYLKQIKQGCPKEFFGYIF